MNLHTTVGRRPLGLAATACLAVGLATTGSAAASPSAGTSSVSSDVLTVTGTSHADQVALRLAAGDPTTLEVDFGDDGSADQTFSRVTFSRIEVALRSGDDRFRIDQGNGPFADEAVTVDAAAGDDSVLGGDGNEIVLGGRGDDSFDGNRGVDTAVFGPGTDSFTWDPGDGSDAIDGGKGQDTLVFNGSALAEVMSLSANGSSSVFRRDLGTIRMDMTDVEVLDLAALGGADAVTVDDMTGTGFRQANVDLGGDGSADIVTVNGTERADTVAVEADGGRVDVAGLTTNTRIVGGEVADRVLVNTLGGRDAVHLDDDSSLIDVTVDLGAGQL
jgi:Ca2+-binding RTX toxin-like protein